jgi:hypothetical protein
MIDYKLANELREAGFPQGGNGRWLVDPEQIVARDRAYVPTLEELIEACYHNGRNFNLSYNVSRGWRAKSFYDKELAANGATPTESVARLWLALYKTV